MKKADIFKWCGCSGCSVLLLLIILFPWIAKWMDVPSTYRLRTCIAECYTVYRAVERYRSSHEGQNPPSLQVLMRELRLAGTKCTAGKHPFPCDACRRKERSGGDEECMAHPEELLKRRDIFYNPGAEDGGPLLAFPPYPYSGRRVVLMWLTNDGYVFYSRERLGGLLWPVYKDYERRGRSISLLPLSRRSVVSDVARKGHKEQ